MAWHWAQTLDQQRKATLPAGGASTLQTNPNLNLCQGTGVLINYWLCRRECELLRGSDRSQRAAVLSWMQKVGLVWPSLLLLLLLLVSSPTSAEPLPPLHYSWPPTGPQRPSPRSALSEGPSRHNVQLKNNFATSLCNSFAKPPPLRFFWHKKYSSSGRDQSCCCQWRGEGLGWQE